MRVPWLASAWRTRNRSARNCGFRQEPRRFGTGLAAESGRQIGMILILREFRARSGDEERLLTALRQRAAAMIREGRAEAVVVCQRTDVPTGVLWIQHHVGEAVPAVDGDQALLSAESGLLACGGVPVRLEFVDGMYQFPLPGCELWGLETCDEERIRALLSVSQLAASDRR